MSEFLRRVRLWIEPVGEKRPVWVYIAGWATVLIGLTVMAAIARQELPPLGVLPMIIAASLVLGFASYSWERYGKPRLRSWASSPRNIVKAIVAVAVVAALAALWWHSDTWRAPPPGHDRMATIRHALAAEEREAPVSVEILDKWVAATSAKITSLEKDLSIENIEINQGTGGCALFQIYMGNAVRKSPPDSRQLFFDLNYPISLEFGKVLLIAPLDRKAPFIKESDGGIFPNECKITILEVKVNTNYGVWMWRAK
jgi:hypothetical protein